MLRNLKQSIFILFVYFFVVACTETDCNSVNNADLKIKFISKTTGNDTSFAFNAVKMRANDSIFYDLEDESSLFILPLNPTTNSVTILFETALSTDSIVANYESRQRLISVDCGPEQLYVGLDTSLSTFDSLIVVASSLKSSNESNIEIYR